MARKRPPGGGRKTARSLRRQRPSQKTTRKLRHSRQKPAPVGPTALPPSGAHVETSEPSLALAVPAHVALVIDRLRAARADRRRADIVETMEQIHNRVKMALRHYGVSDTIECTHEEMDTINTNVLKRGLNAGQMREEVDSKRRLVSMITEYLIDCKQRQDLLLEIGDWLASATLDDLPTEAELEETILVLENADEGVSEAAHHTSEVAEKLTQLGRRLLKEAGYDPDETEAARRKRLQREARKLTMKKVFNEGALLEDPANFEMAIQEVKSTMEQAVRMVKTSFHKTTIRNGLKQYKFIMKVIQHRLAELADRNNTIIQLEMKVEQLTNAKTRLEKEVEKGTREINRMSAQMTRLEVKVRSLEETNASLEEEVAELEARVEEINSTRPTSAATSRHSVTSLRRQSTRVRIGSGGTKDSAISVTSTLRSELDEVKVALEQEVRKTAELQVALTSEKETVAILRAKEKIDEVLVEDQKIAKEQEKGTREFRLKTLADDNDTLERQIVRLKADIKCKNEIIEYQELRLADTRDDFRSLNIEDVSDKSESGTKPKAVEIKKVMTRIKKEHEIEVNRLKSHVEKEKQRAEADIRRLEQAHKEQLANVHKQSVHLLRAINRFKGAMATILDRESLQAAANDVRRVPDLQTDETGTDTRLLLTQMAGGAVELLVSIEFKLSQALMNKRLEVKDKSLAKNFATKDLEFQMGASQRARLTADQLQEKLRESETKLQETEDALKYLRKQQDARYRRLNERYRSMVTQYERLQRGTASLQADFGETLKRKEKQLRAAVKQRQGMVNLVDEQQTTITQITMNLKQRLVEHEERYHMSLVDLQQNLGLLQEAFTDGRINHDIYTATVDIIRQMMALPVVRLRNLMKRYIAFRKLTDTKETLETQLSQRPLSATREEFSAYLRQIDENLTTSADDWRLQCYRLESQRKQLFMNLTSIFSDIAAETGLLLIQPLAKDQREAAVHPSPPPGGQSAAPSASPYGRRRVVTPLKAPPGELKGTSMPIGGGPEPMWKLPALPPAVATSAMTTPRLLDFDVNERLRVAQKALRRAQRRPWHLSIAEPFDYEDCVVRSLRELVSRKKDTDQDAPLQRTSTPTMLNFINKSCPCGSICTSPCGHK